jgi:CheY-like chemotaxis protein
MTEPLRIALLGFSGSERAALEAFLRVAHRRVPAYARVTEVEQAELVLVDADDPAQHARAAGLGSSSRCVAVGAVALPAAVLQLPRPLNVLRLFSRLDRLLEGPPVASPGSAAAGGSIASAGPIAPINAAVPAAPIAAAAPAVPRARTPPMVREQPTAFAAPDEMAPTMPMPLLASEMAPTVPMGLDDELAPPPRAPAPPLLAEHERISLVGFDDEPVPAPSSPTPPSPPALSPSPRAASSTSLPAASSAAPPAASSASPTPARGPVARKRLKHVLVVDDSEEVLRFLVAQLEPLGFALHRTQVPAEAVESARRRSYEFVFVHVEVARDGGARLAGQLRLAARDRGHAPPAVVLFGTPKALTALFARGVRGLADVEAALALPLRRDELLDVLGSRDLRQQAFAPTAPQSTFA